eukprot:TRINITY_DN21582_c0_g1_i1.p1 TRINITY_DN21582_c0_g1~~TRINITY_DN21582_c0_g1_i1.p1  ORF type:complete len:298 (+),score=30.39 TRINITY_DN21582_c0_g1_i1:162-1055(+)
MARLDLWVGCIGLSLYTLLVAILILTIVLVHCCGRKVSQGKRSIRWIFRIYIFFFSILRTGWISFQTFDGGSSITYILNRLSITLYFSAVGFILIYWRQVYRSRNYKASFPKVGWGMLAASLLLLIITLATIVQVLKSGYANRDKNSVYNMAVFEDVILSGVLALAFLVLGCHILAKTIMTSSSNRDSKKKRMRIAAISFITIIFEGIFCSRTYLFAYRLVTGVAFGPTSVFYIFAYFIPDVVPMVLTIFLIEADQRQDDSHHDFIDGLYEDQSIVTSSTSSSVRESLLVGNSDEDD